MSNNKLNLYYTKVMLRMKKLLNQLKMISDTTSNDDLNEGLSEQILINTI